jgi:hypothetical protein
MRVPGPVASVAFKDCAVTANEMSVPTFHRVYVNDILTPTQQIYLLKYLISSA